MLLTFIEFKLKKKNKSYDGNTKKANQQNYNKI